MPRQNGANAHDSFKDCCYLVGTHIANLITHPECPKKLRLKMIETVCDLMNSSEADIEMARAEIETNHLLPLYLLDYTKAESNMMRIK